MIDSWVEAYRTCGTYQSGHGVTEPWVEVIETCGTYKSDREEIDLWVEVTDACQADRVGVELLSSRAVHSVFCDEIALAPVCNICYVGQILPLATSHVELKGNEQWICRFAIVL